MCGAEGVKDSLIWCLALSRCICVPVADCLNLDIHVSMLPSGRCSAFAMPEARTCHGWMFPAGGMSSYNCRVAGCISCNLWRMFVFTITMQVWASVTPRSTPRWSHHVIVGASHHRHTFHRESGNPSETSPMLLDALARKSHQRSDRERVFRFCHW
jgi:hypothetical protein